MDCENLMSVVEAVLFTADRPVPIKRIQDILGEEAPTLQELEELIETLEKRYADSSHGFELREAQGGYHFCTKAENASWVRKFLEAKPFKLSRSALETLAIIAYRQPITRAEVDKVRGIDSSHLVRTLIEKAIVKMGGKADVPGRPVQYATTPKFLELVGLKDLSELPPLSELKELEGDTPKEPEQTIEQGLERFISDQVTSQEVLSEEDEKLKEIDGIIDSARKPTKEVYESKLDAEIAAENESAAASLKSLGRRRKRMGGAKKKRGEAPIAPNAPAAEASVGKTVAEAPAETAVEIAAETGAETATESSLEASVPQPTPPSAADAPENTVVN